MSELCNLLSGWVLLLHLSMDSIFRRYLQVLKLRIVHPGFSFICGQHESCRLIWLGHFFRYMAWVAKCPLTTWIWFLYLGFFVVADRLRHMGWVTKWPLTTWISFFYIGFFVVVENVKHFLQISFSISISEHNSVSAHCLSVTHVQPGIISSSSRYPWKLCTS